MSRLVLPVRPAVGDQVQVNGGKVHTITATEAGGILRFEDGSTATWRLDREVAS